MNVRRIACLVLALAFPHTVVAADAPNPLGYPKKGEPGGGVGAIRIWVEEGVWHLRTSTEDSKGAKDKLMVFTGSIRCDGKLTVEGKMLEKGNGQTADTLTVHTDGNGFDFRFATFGARDDAEFTVGAKGKTLKFKMMIDGEKAQTHRILIGVEGAHPEKNEFALPALVKDDKKK